MTIIHYKISGRESRKHHFSLLFAIKMCTGGHNMKTKTNDVWVTTTEEFILNYAALPKEFEDWRYYRIEYYGDGPYAIKECSFFAPPWFDRDTFEKLFERPKKWNEIPNR